MPLMYRDGVEFDIANRTIKFGEPSGIEPDSQKARERSVKSTELLRWLIDSGYKGKVDLREDFEENLEVSGKNGGCLLVCKTDDGVYSIVVDRDRFPDFTKYPTKYMAINVFDIASGFTKRGREAMDFMHPWIYTSILEAYIEILPLFSDGKTYRPVRQNIKLTEKDLKPVAIKEEFERFIRNIDEEIEKDSRASASQIATDLKNPIYMDSRLIPFEKPWTLKETIGGVEYSNQGTVSIVPNAGSIDLDEILKIDAKCPILRETGGKGLGFIDIEKGPNGQRLNRKIAAINMRDGTMLLYHVHGGQIEVVYSDTSEKFFEREDLWRKGEYPSVSSQKILDIIDACPVGMGRCDGLKTFTKKY